MDGLVVIPLASEEFLMMVVVRDARETCGLNADY